MEGKAWLAVFALLIVRYLVGRFRREPGRRGWVWHSTLILLSGPLVATIWDVVAALAFG